MQPGAHSGVLHTMMGFQGLLNLQLFENAGVCYSVAAMARTDVQLMLDVKAGDEASFELLLQRYRTPLVNFLYRMVRNREQAEDLAQEVFLRVYRAREDYVPSAKFTTWLFRIATNLALNSVRDTRYQKLEISVDAPITTDAEDGDQRTMDIPEQHPNIEQHLVEDARKKMIRHAIDKLPEKQRAAVLLHKYQELDYSEISKILNCSESALKSLLFRAYESLRVELAPLVALQAQH
jgi:RNA polymerase sigma-70 factor (ECF subfamily)